MVINYFGKQFFKFQHADTVFALNPISKDSKEFDKAKFGSDVCLITTKHPDFNGVDSATYNEKVPFVIDGPGEYEVGDTYIRGFRSEAEIGKDKYINTIYVFDMDGIRVCFLGALSNKESISKDLGEYVDEVDVLVTPTNGDSTIGAQEAHKIATMLNAKMVIPMDFDKDSLKDFLKELGADGAKEEEKLTLKKKDLVSSKMQVVVLKK